MTVLKVANISHLLSAHLKTGLKLQNKSPANTPGHLKRHVLSQRTDSRQGVGERLILVELIWQTGTYSEVSGDVWRVQATTKSSSKSLRKTGLPMHYVHFLNTSLEALFFPLKEII